MSDSSNLRHNVLRPTQALQLLSYTIPAHETALIVGAPGVGKSDILRQSAVAAKFQTIIMHPATSDPTKFEGLPFPAADRKSAEFLPYGDLKRILDATEPTLVILEDFGQAPVSVQAAAMQLLHSASGERRLGDKIVPKHITFALTSNRRTDRAGVQGILETVKSRCSTIIEVMPTLEDWKEWAISNGIAQEIIGFLNFRKEFFMKFEATADMTNSPSPRTWHATSRLLQLGVPKHLRLPMFSGAVGDGAAGELVNYLETVEEAPDIGEILKHPKTAPIPPMEKQALLYAVSSGLSYSASKDTMRAITTYAQRMFAENKSEFATLIIVDSVRRDRTLTKHEAYIDYCLSKAGDHIIEARQMA